MPLPKRKIASQAESISLVLPEPMIVPEEEDYGTNIDIVAFAQGFNDCIAKSKNLSGRNGETL